MTERFGVTAAVLAGGQSRRMGQDKAFLELDGRPLIAVIVERLRQVADEVIISTNDVERFADLADRCVQDIYPGVGTLGGLHAALAATRTPLMLAVGCDMPDLNPAVLDWFIHQADGVDLVVLRADGYVEPLHAVYRTSCLAPIEATIQSGERCAYAFYDTIRVRYVGPAEIAHLDPGLDSFQNVNTPEQWRRVVGRHDTSGNENARD